MDFKELYDYMANYHEVILLEEEAWEILHICTRLLQQTRKAENEAPNTIKKNPDENKNNGK